MTKLLRYSYTPGVRSTIAAWWPSESKVPRLSDSETLVLAVHPYCACTRATLGELAIIEARCDARLNAAVLFYGLGQREKDWSRSAQWQAAAQIPGVRVFEDADGTEIRRFGAATSGEALLYGENGKLLFHGGITVSRGHSGDNYGRDAVIALLNNKAPRFSTAPVFGCSLLGKVRVP